MTRDHKFETSRRSMLAGGLGVVAAGLVAETGVAQQPTKLAQSVVMYQDHPKGRSKVQHLRAFPSAQCLPDRRRRHQPERLVRRVHTEADVVLLPILVEPGGSCFRRQRQSQLRRGRIGTDNGTEPA